jgi:hypothetical protein
MMNYRYLHSLAAILCLALSPGVSFAQSTTGTLTGTVLDSSGAAVPGARVAVRNTATNASVESVTGDSGTFTVPSLLPGGYDVTVEAAAFKKVQAKGVEIRTAQTTTQNFTLEVGQVSETISVTSDSPLINPDSAQVTTTIQNKIMQDLPFPDRSMLSVALLAAGVQGDPQYNSGVQSELPGIFTQPVSPGVSISAGGGRPGSGSVLVDGSDVTSAGFARTIMTFSADTCKKSRCKRRESRRSMGARQRRSSIRLPARAATSFTASARGRTSIRSCRPAHSGLRLNPRCATTKSRWPWADPS